MQSPQEACALQVSLALQSVVVQFQLEQKPLFGPVELPDSQVPLPSPQ